MRERSRLVGRGRVAWSCVLGLLAWACTAEPALPATSPGVDGVVDPATSADLQGAAGVIPSSSGSSSPAGSVGSGAAPDPAGAGIPCDVATILSVHCVLCHGSPPQFSAPISLVSASDFSATSPFSRTVTVAEASLMRIQSIDPAIVMPPPGMVQPLPADELATLAFWLQQGAKPTAPGCVAAPPQGSAQN